MKNTRAGNPGRTDALTLAEPQCHIQGMSAIRTVCVYCGSGPGADPQFRDAARTFGKILATNRVGLVYGGGSLGLMGAPAPPVLQPGGRVTGHIPGFLTRRRQV